MNKRKIKKATKKKAEKDYENAYMKFISIAYEMRNSIGNKIVELVSNIN